jgi:transposase InsO family protein
MQGSLRVRSGCRSTYNRRRRQRGLGKLTPVEFELAFAPTTEAEAA